MTEQNDMTEEEAEYWDDYFTRNPPKTDPAKPGVFARRGFKMFAVDDYSAEYITATALATRRTPAEVISEMVRERARARLSATV